MITATLLVAVILLMTMIEILMMSKKMMSPVITLYRKLKYLFPEMKLCGLVPNFYIHISGAIYIFP